MTPRQPVRSRLSVALLAVVLATPVIVLAADAWPKLQRGQWEFQKIVGTQKNVSSKCVNPIDDLKRQQSMLRHAGCKFTPVTRAGNVYTYTSTCDTKKSSGVSTKTQATTTITVDGDSAYQLETLSTANNQSSKESVVARRLGACKK